MADGSREFLKRVMKSVRGPKKKPGSDVSVRSTRAKKKPNSDVSVRKKKVPGGAGESARVKKKANGEISQRSKRVKKTVQKSKEKLEDPEEADTVTRTWGKMEEKITPPAYMNAYQATEEQKEAFVKFAKKAFTQGVDGLLKEFNDQLRPYVGGPFQRAIFDQNKPKNRYTDIICNDLTRVVIADGRGSDYIHANYVRGEPLFNEFVCTQGPTKATVIEFWRMILHIKAFNIIMLCETMEQNKVKCEQYWPPVKGGNMTFGDITVENIDSVETDKSETRLSILSITCGSDKHTLIHHHWKSWPDRSIPRSGKCALRILRSVRYSTKPIVVHCSAGVGRTGTLVCIEMCLQRLLSTLQLDLISVCKRLRDQRLHVLQVDTQYVYLALVVIEFGRACGYLNYPELEHDYEKFRADLIATMGKRDINGFPIPQPAAAAAAVTPGTSAERTCQSPAVKRG